MRRQTPDFAYRDVSPAFGDERVWHLWSLVAGSEPIAGVSAVPHSAHRGLLLGPDKMLVR